jgi:hypothetical protein
MFHHRPNKWFRSSLFRLATFLPHDSEAVSCFCFLLLFSLGTFLGEQNDGWSTQGSNIETCNLLSHHVASIKDEPRPKKKEQKAARAQKSSFFFLFLFTFLGRIKRKRKEEWIKSKHKTQKPMNSNALKTQTLPIDNSRTE